MTESDEQRIARLKAELDELERRYAEADEWSRESVALTTGIEELGRALRQAAATYRRADDELAESVPQVRAVR